MDVDAAIARRATVLLVAVAHGDRSAAVLYDDLLADLLYRIASRRGRFLAASAAERLGLPPGGLPVRAADEDEVANVAVELALNRARGAALRFDPAKGDGASWALGALGAAYMDAVRHVTRSRRIAVELPVGDELEPLAGAGEADPASIVAARDAVMRALEELSRDERFVIVARLQYGFTYGEIAEQLFRDAAAAKRVDRLLQSARIKLRAAEKRWAAQERRADET